MGFRTRSRLLLIGLVALAACGQTAEAPTADDSSVPSDTGMAATTATSASTTTTTTSTTTIPPETTTVTDDPDSTTPGDLQPASTPPVPVTEVPNGSVDPTLSGLAERAVADLAGRLDVDATTIDVAVAERVVWPDSSLGCPAPGMAYLQVQTDGFRILLTSDGTTYSYHGGGNRIDPFLCAEPDTRIPKRDSADV